MFKRINEIVKILVVTDFFYNAALGSFAPIFAIFVANRIEGGSASVVGFAVAVYWLVKSLFQLPVARFLDKTKGEQDDFWAMFFGYLLSGFVPLAYIFIRKPIDLYMVQAFYGFVMAWAVPAWYGIFTRHVDKWRISFEWSIWSVFSIGLATAASAAFGGFIADKMGFDVVLMMASGVAILASLLLLSLRKHLLPRIPQEKTMPERHGHR
jgi:MFS family permease